MRLALRILLPLLILAGAYFGFKGLLATKEDPRGFKPPPTVTRVEATTLKPQKYQVMIQSQGTIEPRTESTLIPEVPGKVIEISPSMLEGGIFEKGDILCKVDPLDYETRVILAERSLAQAKSLVEQEKARGIQAAENWKRLGKRGEPGSLAKREPQLADAAAQVAGAEAELRKAHRDLERTAIRAPYPGRIMEKMVDVGQYVTNGTTLARIYAIDYVEVKLPLKPDDLAFVDLPEAYRHESVGADAPRPEVVLTGSVGSKDATWKGRVVRVAGAVDTRSRQLFVTAQVDDPYKRQEDGTPPLKIGQFVQAKIQGHVLEAAFVIPRNAVRANNEVILIDKDSKMRRRVIEPLWSTNESVIVANSNGGVQAGDVLCITPIAFPADGAPVLATIDGRAPTESARKGPPGKRPTQ